MLVPLIITYWSLVPAFAAWMYMPGPQMSGLTRRSFVGPRDEKLSQLRSSLEPRVARLQEKIEQEYGVTGVSVEAGAVILDFADHNEDLA